MMMTSMIFFGSPIGVRLPRVCCIVRFDNDVSEIFFANCYIIEMDLSEACTP